MKLISGTHPYMHPHPGVNTHKHTHTLQKKKKNVVDVARLCGPQLSDSVVSFPKIIPTTLRGIPGLQPPAGAGLKLTELALPLPLPLSAGISDEHHHAQLGSLLGVSCPAASAASWSKQLLSSPASRPEGVCRWSSRLPII